MDRFSEVPPSLKEKLILLLKLRDLQNSKHNNVFYRIGIVLEMKRDPIERNCKVVERKCGSQNGQRSIIIGED